jgi:hypothetical protein
MTTRFLIPALLALSLPGLAQNTDLIRPVNGLFVNGYSPVRADAGQVRGTPFLVAGCFLVAGWLPATLTLVGSSTATAATLRYDVYRQELRVRRPQGDSVVVPLNRVKEFSLTGLHRRFVCYPAGEPPTDVTVACAEVLADGPQLQFLKFWRKKLVKQAADAGSYASNTTVEVLEEKADYYLRWPADGHLTAVRLKRSSLE